jgi:hypothetical protein
MAGFDSQLGSPMEIPLLSSSSECIGVEIVIYVISCTGYVSIEKYKSIKKSGFKPPKQDYSIPIARNSADPSIMD